MPLIIGYQNSAFDLSFELLGLHIQIALVDYSLVG
jgi:hypothetical protein